MPDITQPVIEQVKQDPMALAVILFGSRARREATPSSDTDLCIVLCPQSHIQDEVVAQREKYLPLVSSRCNIVQFDQLPLYVRHRVLKEGTVLFCKNEDLLYDVAYRTAQAFEDYKPYYRRYLEEVARAGSRANSHETG